MVLPTGLKLHTVVYDSNHLLWLCSQDIQRLDAPLLTSEDKKAG